VRATGARDAHGHILDREGGALFVHLHREAGLAHRHYVVKPWQVRVLAFLTARVMLALYVVGLVTWGWMASQAAQVPFLRHTLSRLEQDAVRLDSLSATLTELQSRYDQVQRMLGAATAQQAAAMADTSSTTGTRPPETTAR
jgi:Tfp pilus assembly protein PilO